MNTNNDRLSQIYSLTPFQEQQLTEAANGDSVSFGIMEIADDDTPEHRQEIVEQMRQMVELVGQGLLQEITPMFSKAIEAFRANNKRGFRVFSMTEVAMKMFQHHKKRKVV